MAPHRPPGRSSPVASDGAVSEVLGSVLLAGVTVVVFGGFATVVLATVASQQESPTGSFAIDADAGASFALVTFVSGTRFDLPDAAIGFSVNGTGAIASFHVVVGTASSAIGPGDVLQVNLTPASDDLGPDARLRFVAAHRATGRTIGQSATTMLATGASTALADARPSLSSLTLTPDPAPADGATVATITVAAAHDLGVAFVRSVTADLSATGLSAQTRLVNDGSGGDARAGDGTWTVQVVVPERSFATSSGRESVAVSLTSEDGLGREATLTGTVALSAPSPAKVATGARYRGVPSSANAGWLNLTNFTFRDASLLAGDQVEVRVSDLGDSSIAWTAIVSFDYGACGSAAGVASVALARDGVSGSVTYAPTDGCLAIDSDSRVLLADVASSVNAAGATEAWTVTGSAATFRYAAAGVSSDNEAVVTFFGDAVTPSRAAIGLGQADFEWAADPPTAPAAPQSLVATRGNAQVSLAWSAPADDGGSAVTGYRIYRGTSSGSLALLDAIGTNASYVAARLTNGQTYYFAVSAVNAIGEGARSSEASATPATTPGAPSSLVATAGPSRVSLAWSAPASNGGSSVTGYRVYRGLAPGALSPIDSIGTNASYVAAGLTNGITYYFAIAAVNAVGEGSVSSEASATPTAATAWFGCPPTTTTSGSVASCSNLQSGSDSDAVATFTEGGGNPRLLEIAFTGTGAGAAGSHSLEVRARAVSQVETLYVQVYTTGGASWSTLVTIPSTTVVLTTFTATLTDAEFAGGQPLVRFADSNTVSGGSDNKTSTWEIEYLKVVTS